MSILTKAVLIGTYDALDIAEMAKRINLEVVKVHMGDVEYYGDENEYSHRMGRVIFNGLEKDEGIRTISVFRT